MKKEFVKPVLTRYDLNSKENIVASVSPAFRDDFLTASWSFTYNVDETGAPVNATEPNQGCFHYFYGDMTDDIIASHYLDTDGQWYTFLGIVATEGNPKYDIYLRCAGKIHT